MHPIDGEGALPGSHNSVAQERDSNYKNTLLAVEVLLAGVV